MSRDDILAGMDDDVDRLTIRALQAEAAGMPGSGEMLIQCSRFIETVAALERAAQVAPGKVYRPMAPQYGIMDLSATDDVLAVHEQYLGGVRLR